MAAKIEFDDLVNQALENAIEDRELTKEAYSKVKNVWDIGSEMDSETKKENLQGLMLIGGNVVKLIEQLSRTNEQIIKLCQIKEKEKSAVKGDSKQKPFDVSDIMKNGGNYE